jgi:hypothetical protein
MNVKVLDHVLTPSIGRQDTRLSKRLLLHLATRLLKLAIERWRLRRANRKKRPTHDMSKRRRMYEHVEP